MGVLLEVIRNGVLQAERVVCRMDAVADLVETFRPLVAVFLCYKGIAEVEEHPGHADDAVDAADGLPDEQSDANALQFRAHLTVCSADVVVSYLFTLKIGDIRHMSTTLEPRNWPRQAWKQSSGMPKRKDSNMNWTMKLPVGQGRGENQRNPSDKETISLFTYRRTRCSTKRIATRWKAPKWRPGGRTWATGCAAKCRQVYAAILPPDRRSPRSCSSCYAQKEIVINASFALSRRGAGTSVSLSKRKRSLFTDERAPRRARRMPFNSQPFHPNVIVLFLFPYCGGHQSVLNTEKMMTAIIKKRGRKKRKKNRAAVTTTCYILDGEVMILTLPEYFYSCTSDRK